MESVSRHKFVGNKVFTKEVRLVWTVSGIWNFIIFVYSLTSIKQRHSSCSLFPWEWDLNWSAIMAVYLYFFRSMQRLVLLTKISSSMRWSLMAFSCISSPGKFTTLFLVSSVILLILSYTPKSSRKIQKRPRAIIATLCMYMLDCWLYTYKSAHYT